jgi:hypothetical protein
MHASCHPLRAAIEEVNAPLFIEILSAAFRIIPVQTNHQDYFWILRSVEKSSEDFP